jgi:Zn-dependent peptidase ImmA (M78 family)
VTKKPEWEELADRQACAAFQADTIIAKLGLHAPVDPLAIVKAETPLILVEGGNFRNAYDGKLKYVRKNRRFLLFYNNKYDAGLPDGKHHPRTRFSIAHELGHYFIEAHHQYLRTGGKSHGSRSEFRADNIIEREADSFAASILLPASLAEPMFNAKELSLDRIVEIADHFKASLLCTAFRAVQLSVDPCAIVGIEDGRVVWMFRSEPLIKAGLYPSKTKSLMSRNAIVQWERFRIGNKEPARGETPASDWFEMYDRASTYQDVFATEYFLPIQILNRLTVLITIEYDDLFYEKAGGEESDNENEEDG